MPSFAQTGPEGFHRSHPYPQEVDPVAARRPLPVREGPPTSRPEAGSHDSDRCSATRPNTSGRHRPTERVLARGARPRGRLLYPPILRPVPDIPDKTLYLKIVTTCGRLPNESVLGRNRKFQNDRSVSRMVAKSGHRSFDHVIKIDKICVLTVSV